MACQQYLPLSVVQLKGKHCRKPHCCNGVLDMFGHGLEGSGDVVCLGGHRSQGDLEGPVVWEVNKVTNKTG